MDGKPVLVVFVPEADVTQKPVYFKATGLPTGAYRRIGSADHRCADPDDRFAATLDVRKPLLLALRQLQSTILDDLPRGFRLDAGELQSRQEPISRTR